MSIATQISAYLVPADVWQQGHPARRDLPPLLLPARDALDIERRALKQVKLRNESRRYTLCCERIQGIVDDLAHTAGLCLASAVWPAAFQATDDTPTALAYLAVIDTLHDAVERMLKARRSPDFYRRVARLFFPPQHAAAHLQIYETFRQPGNLPQLLAGAVKRANPGGQMPVVSEAQCRRAFEQRYDLLKRAQGSGMGLVDVVELV